MSYDYIGTFTNKKYHFLDPSVEEVCIEDIAQALSMNCRYSGHVKKFYSVAEHSVYISELILDKTGDYNKALAGLLHDASEAYLTDVPRPIKPFLSGYHQIETRAEKCIQEKFGVGEMCEYGKHLDHHICGAEAKQLFKSVPEWASDFEEIDVVVEGWTPETAKYVFLFMFKFLGGKDE